MRYPVDNRYTTTEKGGLHEVFGAVAVVIFAPQA